MTWILWAVYPLLVIARLLAAALGRDPLRLQKPADGSLWLPRRGQPEQRDYFSEESCAEGRGHGGFGWLAAKPLLWLAACCAPGQQPDRAGYSPVVDREEGIPDEVYTLW